MSYDDVYRESLHDWLDNRPEPDGPSRAEAEQDEMTQAEIDRRRRASDLLRDIYGRR